MGTVVDIYDPSWVDLWGLSPGPSVEVASWSFHLPSPGGIGSVARDYTSALSFDPCSYCGLRPERGHKNELDHIEPRSLGGPDTADNRSGACRGCNRRKRAKRLLHFLMEATP